MRESELPPRRTFVPCFVFSVQFGTKSSLLQFIYRAYVTRMLATLRRHDGDDNENVKKAMQEVEQAKQQLCRHCATITTGKCLISRCMEEVNKRQLNFLSLSELERTQLHFLSDVSAAVAVVGS